MKKIGDLMAELGFRQDAPESVKKAFIESLSRSLAEQSATASAHISEKTQAIVASPAMSIKKPTALAGPEQLSLFETNPEPLKPRAG